GCRWRIDDLWLARGVHGSIRLGKGIERMGCTGLAVARARVAGVDDEGRAGQSIPDLAASASAFHGVLRPMVARTRGSCHSVRPEETNLLGPSAAARSGLLPYRSVLSFRWKRRRRRGNMKRREFVRLVGGAAVAWPLAARAQQERMRRIGFLRAAPPSERELEALLRGLSDHGWVQGRNFVLLPQWGDGNIARLPELAVLLLNTGVDIVLTDGVVTTRAARAVTGTIPIVMTAAADPFVGGMVQSLARPGGNVTGFSSQSAEIAGKVVEIFKDMIPGLIRVAVIIRRDARAMVPEGGDRAAKGLGINLAHIDLPGPEAAGTAIRQAVSAGAQGALVRVGPFFSSTQRRTMVDLAADLRLPVMYDRREFVEQGGLATYASDTSELCRRAAGYVSKILSGTHPSDLPIEQATKFELVINLKTAKALGLEIPATLLARADEVIE